jgi:hypothetical protein
MSEDDADRQGKRVCRLMTVAQIRAQKGAKYSEVAFLESARFYRLSRKNPRHDEVLKNLRHAMAKGRVLKVRFASPDDDIIEDVQVQ